MGSVRENRLIRSEWILLLTILVFAFIPSINQLIVDRLVSGMGSEVLTIAGQIEWFDLFNETILAFLTVPMYFLLNKVASDKNRMAGRIGQTMLVGMIVYTAISLAIFAYAGTLTSYMTAPAESTAYLRTETIGFIIGFLSSYMYIVFVVRGQWRFVAILLIAKIAMLSLGNIILTPAFGVVGVAYTNICVNTVISITSFILLYKDGLMRWTGFDRSVMTDWARIGIFSGGQVLMANIVYMLVVVKMVNDVSEVGNYWLANNFIWGWLLIPMTAIGEMVKREYENGFKRVWNYILLTGIVLLIWLLSVPFWGFMFTDIVATPEPEKVLSILYALVPFYVFYALDVVLQGVMVSVGKTSYLFATSAIVNIVYYGIMYLLYLNVVFTASMGFVIGLFGVGLIVCLIMDVAFYIKSRNDMMSRKTTDFTTPE